MAQKKSGGLINRLIMGSEKSEGYARASLPSNRWELFWDVLKGSFGKLVGINLLVLLFFIPLAILIFMMYMSKTYLGTINGFSQNVGIGYPALPTIAGLRESIDLQVKLQMNLFLPICLIIAAVGVSGGAYVIRNMIWTEGIFVANDFWKGIKQNFGIIAVSAVVFSLVFYVSQWSMGISDYMIAVGEGSKVWLNIARALTLVMLGFIMIMLSFMITMGVTYELKFFKLLRNAFIFTLALLPFNVFFLLIAILPFLIFLLSGICTMIGIMLAIFLSFSWFLLVWTNYSHWAFDKFINDKIPGAKKNRGIYEKVMASDAEAIKKYREQLAASSRTILTRRPIKPITDDELKLVELPQSYSRADLQRLQESKEAIYKDTEEYVNAHKDDPEYQLTEEEKQFEQERERRKEEARLALEGKKIPKQKKKK